MNSMLRVWLVLLGLTLGEVGLAAAGARGGLMLAILLTLSTVKAWLIVAWFMHLRFERRHLALALLPALIVCILLLNFIFPDSVRLRRMSSAGSPEAPHSESTK